MKKFWKWFVIITIILVVSVFAVGKYLTYSTKQASPESIASYKQEGFDIEITYSRPFKNERKIFGGLVAFDKTWRTGANEATEFVTNTDLIIDGQKLPKGNYTLWTVPNAKQWEVIFNSGEYRWGVDWDQVAQRDPHLDIVNYTAPVQKNFKVMEQFTIDFLDGPIMTLAWDYTRVDVPLSRE